MSTLTAVIFLWPRLPPRLCWMGQFLVLGLAVGLGACGGPWRDTYFKKGVGQLTQAEIRERLGPPHTAKTSVLDGDSVWTYRYALGEQELKPWNFSFMAEASQSVYSLMGKPSEAAKPILYCYRYTLTFTEEDVLEDWKREECVPGTRATLSAK